MSPLPSLLFPNMHHQTCSLTTWHYLSLSSSLTIGITLCLCLLTRALLLAWEICLSIEADNRMYIVSSSLMRVVFNSRLFLAAFRYISIILFRAAMVFGEKKWTSIKDTLRCFRHTIYHCITCMTYRECECWLPKRFGNGLASDRLIFVHVHTFTSDTASDKVP